MEQANIQPSASHLRLQMRIGTEFLIEIVDLKMRIQSKVAGMEEGNYILVDGSPLNTVAGSYLDETVKSSPIIIRYLCDGYVYGFQTVVLNMIYKPAKLLFLAFPEHVEECSVRSNPRYDCILPAETNIAGNNIGLVITDISNNGCGCRVRNEGSTNKDKLSDTLRMNEKIQLSVYLPGMAEKVSVSGVVMHVNLDNHSITFGVKFEETSPDVRAKLDKFMSLISVT